MWDMSCPDWSERLRSGRSLVPDLPLNKAEADLGVAIFDEMRLPDVPGNPKFRDAAGEWFRDIARASFGSWDPETQTRSIRDIFALAPKGSSKTSYSAGLMLSVMLMNKRPRAEALFVGPTQAISDRAYEQAAGMIDESPELKRRFLPRDHLKTIVDLYNKSEMKVKTFDVQILTGSILIFVLLDELHLLGRSAHTTKVLRQIRGGLEKTPEGQLLITTTQSDEKPTGAFRDELRFARQVRDGLMRGKVHRSTLPILYEFPDEIARDAEQWQDAANWPMVMPNLGRSVHLESLVADWKSELSKGEHAVKVWASQHLNIEIGVGIQGDGWVGAIYWERRAVDLTLKDLLRRCEVAIVGIDGGGMDDLFGLAVLGRVKGTRRWLSWSHAWCHRGVLDRRKSIAGALLGFEQDGDLTIVDDELKDLSEIVGVVRQVRDSGILGGVGVDPAAIGQLVDELALIDITLENDLLIGVTQGVKLMSAIKGVERKLADGTLEHASSAMMDWCAGNVRIEALATAIRATKTNAGDAKIDPVMALYNAAMLMAADPEPMNVGSMEGFFASFRTKEPAHV